MKRSCDAEKLPITVVVLTKNEADVVARAIGSAVGDFAEVIVLDSVSDDNTVAVARAAGATVYQNEFKGYASQRNHALKDMPKRHDWVLFLDADEEISGELVLELRREFSRIQSDGTGMAYIRRKDYFLGKWIRRSSGYPTWFGRLCHAQFVTVLREINEEYQCDRPVIRLQGHLLHYPFAKGLTHWIDRHNRYSSAEAFEMVAGGRADPKLIFSLDPGKRRKGFKQIYMSLPLRPIVGFLFLYLFRGGFMDGRAGIRFAILRGFYEYMINLKLHEIRAVEKEKKGGERQRFLYRGSRTGRMRKDLCGRPSGGGLEERENRSAP